MPDREDRAAVYTRRLVAVWLLLALFGINGAAIAEAISLGRPEGSCCSQCKSGCQCRRTQRDSDAPGWFASGGCDDRCGCRRTLVTFRAAPALPEPKPAGRVTAVPVYVVTAPSISPGYSAYPAFLYQRPPPVPSM